MIFTRAPVKWARSIAWRSAWVDLSILLLLSVFVYALVGVAREWTGPFHSATEIELSITALPRYAFLSLVRGFLAYGLSLLFTIAYGYLAAHSPRAEKVMIPFLDILQSVPVLGFLPGVVLALVRVFPSSNIGLELACVLMIFTGQVWNMTFSFYSSVKSVPTELREVAALARLRRLEVLKQIEIPFATTGLLWNSMLAMAGGWFFLMVVESFSLGDQAFRLPGIGSYMAVAIETGDSGAIVAGIVAMTVVIVLVDRCFWAPLVYASQRSMAAPDAEAGPKPIVLQLLEQSQTKRLVYRWREEWEAWRERHRRPVPRDSASPADPRVRRALLAARVALLVAASSLVGYGLLELARMVTQISPLTWLAQLRDTCYTGLRVTVAVVLGSLWTVPVGVWIGTQPKWTRRLQPVVQVVAAFPAPMIFPIVTFALLWAGIPFELGAAILMVVGSQWYILFNVIGGATRIPSSLFELADAFRVRGLPYWRDFILPAVFPSLVNGWITAAGGAWNASIVSEYVYYGGERYVASGIGASISTAAQQGDYPRLAAGIVVMITVIIIVNRLFWNRLYRLAETRFRMEV